MKKNYQRPEIIEEIVLDRKILYASSGDTVETPIPDPNDPGDN